MSLIEHSRLFVLALSPLLVLGACGPRDHDAGADPAAAVPAAESAAPAAAPTDTAAMAAAPETAPKDADQEFLRSMLDHHLSMIRMAHEATEKGGPEVKALAKKIDQKQDAETDTMEIILQTAYNDTHRPMLMPDAKPMLDSLSAKSGSDYDMTFQMHVVHHHGEGIAMIERYLPRLARPEVRALAERMKADQQRDIREIQAKMKM